MSKNNTNNTNNTTKKEAVRCTVTGIITSAFKGATKFDKNEAIRIGLKLDDKMMLKLYTTAKSAGIYDNTAPGFIPKWYQEPDKTEFINVKTGYAVKVRVQNNEKFNQVTDYDLEDDILNEYGSINGSHCALALNLKDGAIYPLAILIDNLKEVTFDDLFDDMDELPFN